MSSTSTAAAAVNEEGLVMMMMTTGKYRSSENEGVPGERVVALTSEHVLHLLGTVSEIRYSTLVLEMLWMAKAWQE